ncbi:MAG TPA: hypothetical protein VK900_06950 [Anaerolineales bacterium]|nr:hypothetical protein [Anaerolineales bacterium]
MKNKLLTLIGGFLAVMLVIGVLSATSAYAQSSPNDVFHGRGPGGGRGLGDGVALQAAAEALGMTTDELINALRAGSTLEELAEEAGVDIEDVRAAIQEARTADLRERIQQAVEAETITQDHADWLFEGLDNGYIGGPGGFKFGGRHGFGLGPGLEQTPAPESTQESSG